MKVTEVESSSLAAHAGMLILKANGKPVLHPTELVDAVRQSGREIKKTPQGYANARMTRIAFTLGSYGAVLSARKRPRQS